jgi:hypothetical protein
MNKFVKQSFGYVQIFRILQARKLSQAATLWATQEKNQPLNEKKQILYIFST